MLKNGKEINLIQKWMNR